MYQECRRICDLKPCIVGYVYYIFIVGRKAYSLTWTLQYVNLFMINTGYIILAGSALKVTLRRNMIKQLYIFYFPELQS
jgi:hypothetical protein